MAKGVRTYRPKTARRRARVHGFLSRMNSHAGRVIKSRRQKGRKRLVVA